MADIFGAFFPGLTEAGRRCVIIGAAPVSGQEESLDLIEPDDFVIVCDGGLSAAVARGIDFQLLVGDFDSFSGALPRGDYEICRLNTEKDDTDGEHAVRTALSRGYKNILMLLSAGGRIDHYLGNICTGGIVAKEGGVCSIFDRGSGTMLYIFKSRTMLLEKRAGTAVSVIPFGTFSDNVSLSGFKYPLDNAFLSAYGTLGISNEFDLSDPSPASVTAGDEPLIVAVTPGCFS